MKVAIFTDNDFATVNGVTTTLGAVLEHAPEDLDLRIYTCDDAGIDTPDYLSLPAIGFGIPFYREMKMYVPPVRRLLRRALLDGVERLHFTTPGPVGLACLYVASRLGLGLVGSFHTDLASYTRVLSGSPLLGRMMERYLRWSYGKCDRVFAPSAATRDLLIRGGIPSAKTAIWRRGVSTRRFTPSKRSAALRERWGASDSRPAILYVGRLSHEKGLAMIDPFVRWLNDAGTAHRLVLVGDGPMQKELQAMCPSAIFMGTLNPEAVSVAMASADVFLFPSQTDTAGNVVLEAQASGLPVLVSDVGGPRENLQNGSTGYVCRNVLEFTGRAAALARDAAKRRRLSQAARGYALTRRWETALDPLYRAYRDVAAEPSSGRIEVRVATA
jgi:glycosyltransferase involved in cell wall biosynthesis